MDCCGCISEFTDMHWCPFATSPHRAVCRDFGLDFLSAERNAPWCSMAQIGFTRLVWITLREKYLVVPQTISTILNGSVQHDILSFGVCFRIFEGQLPTQHKPTSMTGTLNLTQFVFFKWLWAPTQITLRRNMTKLWAPQCPNKKSSFQRFGLQHSNGKCSQWQLSAGPRYHRMMDDVQPGTGTVATVNCVRNLTFGTFGTVRTVRNWSDDCVMKRIWTDGREMVRTGAGTVPKLQAGKPRRHRWTALPFPQRATVPGNDTSRCKT